ncbi:hypothetical protein N9Z90_00080 [Synechococcus sp. AH-707-D15]|nr:hypothetical protein [Synechococcus sp. AH-707-D15]
MEAWRLDAGDTGDVDGIGLTESGVNQYRTAIKEITESSDK